MASRRVKPPADFFFSGGAHGAESGSCSVEECGRFVVVGQVERSGSDAAWSQRQRDDASCLAAEDGTKAAIENQFASSEAQPGCQHAVVSGGCSTALEVPK